MSKSSLELKLAVVFGCSDKTNVCKLKTCVFLFYEQRVDDRKTAERTPHMHTVKCLSTKNPPHSHNTHTYILHCSVYILQIRDLG